MPDAITRAELAERLKRAWFFSDAPTYPLVRRWLYVADVALAAITTQHEVECPACGATVRARMADHPEPGSGR